ncbi:MAG: homocysteine S-methyltransferase family protein [Verrucomicrobia bacterium]|nr:homocysteine S-methyltransferase family protein [Verrucomicrobiota bacterium]
MIPAHPLRDLLEERIVILDGAMGTTIQRYKLTEEEYRGERFAAHPTPLKGNNDLLCLTKPEVIEGIHRAYFDAGADLVETNTFNATSLSQEDYRLAHLARELNLAAAKCARRAADEAMAADPSRRRYVAGAVGPLSKTLSISRDVNDPGARDVTFAQVSEAYREQIVALLDGGVDVLLVETIFDTLNAKAAIFAILEHFDAHPERTVPLMISGTITDLSGRTLTGQTVEAFYNSVSHAPLLSIGLNCALGPKEMRPYIEELSRIAPIYVSCYPNAGLPDPLSPTGFPETPETLAPQLREWAEQGWLNIVGGCCGTTPEHIRAIAEAVRGVAPRKVPVREEKLRLSGLEALAA